MIGVLVGNQDAVDRIGRDSEFLQAAKRLAAGESGIDEQARPAAFDQGDIARAARRQNRDAYGNRRSPVI
jgi:hypothetical protein